MNSAEQVLARTYGGPSNPSRIGVESAVRAVLESADLALREVGMLRGAIHVIGAGLAGTADAVRREQVRSLLQAGFPGARITMLTDLEAALAGAGEIPAVVLVAGTGSAAFGRNAAGEVARAGGYGRFGSDQGSAFDIGRRAIAMAIEKDAAGAEFALGKQMLERLRCAEWPVVQHRAQTMPDDIFPPLFPVIAEAADFGGEAACGILREAAKELASLVGEVATKLGLGGEEFLLAKIGGMVGRSRFFDAQMDEELRRVAPRARIGGLRISPAEAAALLAKAEHGD